jgi:L-fucose isomerase-like protein
LFYFYSESRKTHKYNVRENAFLNVRKLVNLATTVKGKAVPVTGRVGPQGFESSRFPHFLENRLTDDVEVVSLERRPPFIPQEDSWY